ncbi:tol-pal system protein YbgF [Saccharobesus litoralis]|uniref:Cell division coordinator CpoB n=1 Tax=Saccharobesus litoralis TaxID=2172099 RepID=A0A2S0VWG1_9ALTE|nr:tol-pal system protein YbgF [Saccharobesus litoralis]AWB68557.1 tol-pal system protein YbgF [Saccharobesus litoralis]
MTKKHLYLALIGAATFTVATPFSFANNTLNEIDQRVSKLERNFEARSRAQIKLAQEIDNLQTEISQLRGISEEHGYKLGQILQRQRDLYQEMESRISSVVEKIESAEPTLTPSPIAPTATVTPTTDVTLSTDLSENDAYERAVNLVLKDKLYDKAIPEFRKFIGAFPSSTYLPNAHYWLGQLLYNKGEIADAAQHFTTVIEHFPESNKRCDATLKLGMVAQKQNETDKARNFYQQVQTDCATTSAARIAKNRIASL